MICPRCGTLVAEDTKKCPACHFSFAKRQRVGDDEHRWCASCGSPIPTGLNVCPECGMPVEGAFDEDGDDRLNFSGAAERAAEDTGLLSAIPPEPKRGEHEIGPTDQSRRTKLLVFSALAALVVVGGTILYIFKPWDPNAYVTHATHDADTSMEGYPGEKQYLSSQDKVEENEKQAKINADLAYIDETYTRLAEMNAVLESAHEQILAYLEDGTLPEGQPKSEEVTSIQKELDERRATLTQDTFIEDKGALRRRSEAVVLIDYLKGAADILAKAWSKAEQVEGSSGNALEVRFILSGSASEHDYDSWHELFTNAYSP